MKFLFWRKLKRKLHGDAERGARESVLEQLFNDFNRNRFSVYKFNFFRGIFFGLGSVLGGTVVLAALLWLLNVTGHLIPGVADFVNQIDHSVSDIRK
ncbi:MAG: DUF5665 domain-containing protein [Candidatus Saccharimonas sp.]